MHLQYPTCRQLGLIAATVLLLATRNAAAIDPGARAPSFFLPDLWGQSFVASDSLLRGEPPTLLIFWNTQCPDCLADLASTATRPAVGDTFALRLVTICTEAERPGDARRLAREIELPPLNLWDRRRTVAADYGATEVSYAAVLVNAGGIIEFIHYDHPESIDDLLDTIWSHVSRRPSAPPTDETDHD